MSDFIAIIALVLILMSVGDYVGGWQLTQEQCKQLVRRDEPVLFIATCGCVDHYGWPK